MPLTGLREGEGAWGWQARTGETCLRARCDAPEQ
jgi:hypothetical protein